ncbi:MAG: UDP-glucose 4-epimerase GalE [Desulfobacteraceae bacterium 4572_88]|nr:MAG: UDP-glucose 4-epimerase GalE [Desulfobacteraceae bacterium 4572_88]
MKKTNILIAGGAGYIGSHMVRDLLNAGYGVITLDNLSTGHRNSVTGGTFIKGDLRKKTVLNKLFSNHHIDAVMHFAAYSLVRESVEDPLKYYQNNMEGTAELLGAMVRHEVEHFIFSSTASVYGEPAETPITEEHPCKPGNPYGASKYATEELLKACDTAYGIKYVSLRYFNAAGADVSGEIGEMHDPETHLIPLILLTAMGQQNYINIFGTDYLTQDGTCVRDYVHVSDLTQAHMLALESLLSGAESDIYNVGNSRGYSVREVIELARKITGLPIPIIETEKRPGDPAMLIASSEKIRKALKWKPRYEELETIIRTAWGWHRRDTER